MNEPVAAPIRSTIIASGLQGRRESAKESRCNRVRNDRRGTAGDETEHKHGWRLLSIEARIGLGVRASLLGDCFGIPARSGAPPNDQRGRREYKDSGIMGIKVDGRILRRRNAQITPGKDSPAKKLAAISSPHCGINPHRPKGLKSLKRFRRSSSTTITTIRLLIFHPVVLKFFQNFPDSVFVTP